MDWAVSFYPSGLYRRSLPFFRTLVVAAGMLGKSVRMQAEGSSLSFSFVRGNYYFKVFVPIHENKGFSSAVFSWDSLKVFLECAKDDLVGIACKDFNVAGLLPSGISIPLQYFKLDSSLFNEPKVRGSERFLGKVRSFAPCFSYVQSFGNLGVVEVLKDKVRIFSRFVLHEFQSDFNIDKDECLPVYLPWFFVLISLMRGLPVESEVYFCRDAKGTKFTVKSFSEGLDEKQCGVCIYFPSFEYDVPGIFRGMFCDEGRVFYDVDMKRLLSLLSVLKVLKVPSVKIRYGNNFTVIYSDKHKKGEKIQYVLSKTGNVDEVGELSFSLEAFLFLKKLRVFSDKVKIGVHDYGISVREGSSTFVILGFPSSINCSVKD